MVHFFSFSTVVVSTINFLRIKSIQHSGKRNGFAHVFEPADPGDDALNPHPKPAVRHAAVLAQVQIPFERLFWQTVLVNSLDELVIRRHALRPTDDFTVAFGCEHVYADSKIWTSRIRSHAERFYFCTITMK